MIEINLWQSFTQEFQSSISKVSEDDLSLAWSSAKARTCFYKEMLAPLATSLGTLIEEKLEAGSELFKVDFAICQNSNDIKVPLIFIESENNAFSAEHEIRKLVNLAAPLRVLITVIQWDEESGVWDKAYRSHLLHRWEKIIYQHHIVWPRPGVVGILIGEWRPNKSFRFYGYGYEEGQRLAVPNPEILLERKVNHRVPRIVLGEKGGKAYMETESPLRKICDAHTMYEEENGRSNLRSTWHLQSEKLDLAFCDPLCEEVSAAQQWLLSGRGEIPNATWLACTVNGYQRRGDVTAFSEWVRMKLPFITAELIGSLSIQELLDLLFYFHRAERFAEGTLQGMASEIEAIVTSIARRVVKTGPE